MKIVFWKIWLLVIASPALASAQTTPHTARLNKELARANTHRSPSTISTGTLAPAEMKKLLGELQQSDPASHNIPFFEHYLEGEPQPAAFHELLIHRSNPSITRLLVDDGDVPDPLDLLHYSTSNMREDPSLCGPTLVLHRSAQSHIYVW